MRRYLSLLLMTFLLLTPVFGATVVTKSGGVQTGDYSFGYPAVTAVEPKGFIDSNNSTNTPLASGATFTGEATDILDIGTIFVVVYSDVDSATDGLVIEMRVYATATGATAASFAAGFDVVLVDD